MFFLLFLLERMTKTKPTPKHSMNGTQQKKKNKKTGCVFFFLLFRCENGGHSVVKSAVSHRIADVKWRASRWKSVVRSKLRQLIPFHVDMRRCPRLYMQMVCQPFDVVYFLNCRSLARRCPSSMNERQGCTHLLPFVISPLGEREKRERGVEPVRCSFASFSAKSFDQNAKDVCLSRWKEWTEQLEAVLFSSERIHRRYGFNRYV